MAPNERIPTFMSESVGESAESIAPIDRILTIDVDLQRALLTRLALYLLSLPTEARMNFPGQPSGWWVWRFAWEQLPADAAGRLRRMCELYDRH